jgi:hypothetical protein
MHSNHVYLQCGFIYAISQKNNDIVNTHYQLECIKSYWSTHIMTEMQQMFSFKLLSINQKQNAEVSFKGWSQDQAAGAYLF